MTELKKAILSQWKERFDIKDPDYAKNKCAEVEEIDNYSELLYHCMNIDMSGHHLIAEKLKMSHRDFAFLLSSHRSLDQGGFNEGGNGFPYKEEERIEDEVRFIIYTYPDGTTMKYQYGTNRRLKK